MHTHMHTHMHAPRTYSHTLITNSVQFRQWDMPSPEDVTAYKKSLVDKNPNALDISSLLQQSLCLYFFSRYCKEDCENAPLPASRIMFIEDVARYKGMYGDEARGAQANLILQNYLTSSSHPPISDLTESNLERKAPRKLTKDEIPALISETNGKGDNCLSLGGPSLDEVKKNIAERKFASPLFDKLECCVLDTLKQVSYR